MIIPMKHMTLVALKQDEERILEALQALNAVQLIDGAEAVASPNLPEAESRVQKLNTALTLMKPYAQKGGLLAPLPDGTLDDINNLVPKALSISEEAERIDRRRSAIRSQTERSTQEMESLRPWVALDTPMKRIASTRNVAVFPGMINVELLPQLDKVDATIEQFGGEMQRAVLAMCPIDQARETLEALKDVGFTEFTFPKTDETPSQAIRRMENDIQALQKENAELVEQLSKLSKDRGNVAAAADAAVISRDREQAKTALFNTKTAFQLVGWVRSDRLDVVEKTVADVTEAYDISVRDPIDGEVPPSVVQNARVVSPFESVTNLYSRPDPYGIDATPLMTPFYFVFFGMMLSDFGYGLLLTIGTLLFLKLKKPKGMMGQLATVLFWGGISTIIWSPLIGTFFGEDFDKILGTINRFPLLIDPMEEPMNMLMLCLVMGFIQIVFGIIIKIVRSFREGDWQTAVFDNICWLLILFGLPIILLLPDYSIVGIVLAAVGVLGILLMKGRDKKNPVMRVVGGLGELYNVTGYLSDILSYARLFALGIATGVIGSVYNMLAAMLMQSPNIIIRIGGTIIGIALLCFLHLFNLAINTLGTFIHCSRLQFIEFYGKFYEPGGKPFKPLGYNTRHVNLTE